MKTARFAAVVEAAGKPKTHLLLISPEKDNTLQAAIKSHRLMTLHRELVGGKKDHAVVGFHPGRARQYLIFPKSLSKFAGSRILGVKYDLLERGDARKRSAAREKVTPRKKDRKVQKPAHPKVVYFPGPGSPDALDRETRAILEIKSQVGEAMEALEQGKQVAAFNLLKRIVDHWRPKGS